MRARVLGFFDKFFDIKPREFLRVQTFFLFLTTTSIFYAIGATVGDTLFLSRFGSREAERLLPWVYIGTGLLTVALTWFYERIEERLPRERFVVGVNLALAVSLLAFRWAIRSEQLWLYYALVIWLEACALIALMLFFSFAGDYFTSRDARRLYGYINGGIAVGSIAGGFAVEPLVRAIGDDNLLYVCAGLLACGALWCALIPAIAKPVEDAESEEAEDASGVPLKAILSQRFIQILIVAVLATQACCWLVDYQLKIVASRALQEEALAIFFGKFYSTLGIVQFLVQFALVGWLLRRFGVVKSLTILPALLCVSSSVFYFHPVFIAAAAGSFIRLVFLETLDEPAQELLFLPLAARMRVRAQSFVEGMVLPLGISLAGVLLLALSRVFTDVRQISLAGILLGLAWIAAILALLPRYRETLAASLGRRGLDAADLSSALASAEGAAAIRGMLAAADPDQQALALDLCADRPLGPLAETVSGLAASPSAEVAVKAIRTLAAEKDGAHLPAVARALEDPRAEVKAAAILAHFNVAPSAAASQISRWSDDRQPAVRVAVLAGCLAHGGRSAGGMALSRLSEMLESNQASERVIAAQVLAQAAKPGTAALFKRLLRDPAVEVRREVVAACTAAPEAGMAPWLVDQLREPRLRPAAAEALESMPLSAVPAFIEMIAQRERPLEERSLLVRILGRFSGLRGAKVLWEILGSNEDVMLRVAAAETLLYMQTRNKAHDLSRYQDDGFLSRRLEELAVINQARAEAGADQDFFSQILFDHARLEIKVALFTMALSQEDHRIEQVEASLFGGSKVQRDNALEIIEVVFPHEKASRIVAAIGPLVAEEASRGAGVEPETLRRLMRMQPWLRVAARRALDERGIKLEGEEKMSGQEAYMYKLMARVSFLKKVRLFEGVSANYLMSLAKIVQERTFLKDEIIFSEGQKADSCYFICEGTIRIVVGGRTAARLGARECVGEMALIENLPYSAAAVADEGLRVLRISADEFNNVLLTHPEITVALLRHVSGRLRESLARSIA